jgi:putative heme-binding domain-containing protein
VYSQEQKKSARPSDHSSGKQAFASACAGCHGLDGKGGEHAPNIVTNPALQKLSQKKIIQIISGGVPGTGMPSFRSLGAEPVKAIAEYVQELQGKVGHESLPGNAKSGKALFFGKAQCSTCHIAAGRGGFIGPDLTTYAQAHPAEKIKAAITSTAERDKAQGMVTAIAQNGDRYQGVVRNEDNFSLELQSTDGAFHLLSKANLKSVARMDSIMPSNYGSRLTEAELNDIVSFIMSLSKAPSEVDSRDGDDE